MLMQSIGQASAMRFVNKAFVSISLALMDPALNKLLRREEVSIAHNKLLLPMRTSWIIFRIHFSPVDTTTHFVGIETMKYRELI